MTPVGRTLRRRKTDAPPHARTWISAALHELASILNQDRADLPQPEEPPATNATRKDAA